MSIERLRIAVLNRQFLSTGGGAERYSMALVEQLAARHEMHVFAQQIDHQWPGVTYHLVSQLLKRPRWINQLWYASATWWQTRRGFDVVHSHENSWHGQVQTVHVLPVKYQLFQGRTGWALAWRWLKVLTSPRLLVYLGLERSRFSKALGRTIVVTSNSLMEQTVQAYPACRAAIQVISPGVNQVNGAASVPQQLAARLRLGLPVQGRGILFVGNDYRKKGLATLIPAMTGQDADCFLMVVGAATQAPQFKAQAEASGLDGRIHFLGARKDMDDVYAAADCLAHPTLEDTFAMVVLEAMAHGLPVVVSCEKFCGIAGLLTHETDALLLTDPADKAALTLALGRVLNQTALRQRLIEAGLALASQFLWESVAQKQEAIYLALCGPKCC